MLDIRTVSYIAVFIAACSTAMPADPNHKDPMAYMPAHGREEVQAMYKALVAISTQVLEEQQQQLEAAANGKLKGASPSKLSQTMVKASRRNRLAERLQMYGEPTAFEVALRGRVLANPYYGAVVQGYASLPTSARFMVQLRAKFRKGEQARQRAGAKLKELASQGKWEEAETALHSILDRLEAEGLWFLSEDEVGAVMKPIAATRGEIETQMNMLHSARAKQSLAQSRAEQLPDYDAILEEVRQAVNNVGTAGQTAWEDETVNGPQLAERISAKWKETHVGTLRCLALDWAEASRTRRTYSSAPLGEETSDGTLGRDYEAFSQAILKSIAELIALESRRLSGDEVAQHYVQYLGVLAPMVRQISDRYPTTEIEQALQDLAKAEPAFGAEVQAYDAGTTELLRWRARVAEAAAKARDADFGPLAGLLAEATRSEGAYIGLFTREGHEQGRPKLLECAPKVLPHAAKKLLGSRARSGDVLRITPTHRAAIARYQSRTYANVPAELDTAAEVDLLKFDLQVTDQLPALTLTSAVAVNSAERGDYVSVGGQIAGTHLEAMITRFAKLPTAASILVPLGELATEGKIASMLPQVLLRFDLQPEWVQHRHFFVQLAPAGAE